MKYIKLFDSNNQSKFWIIYGTFDEVNIILDNIGVSFPSLKKQFYDYKEIIGIGLGYGPGNGHDHYVLYDLDEVKICKEVYRRHEYVYQGELKLNNDNGTVYNDKFDAEVDNYNL